MTDDDMLEEKLIKRIMDITGLPRKQVETRMNALSSLFIEFLEALKKKEAAN
jgi:hypothetical protein